MVHYMSPMNFRQRFPALYYRDFLLMWLGQLVSFTGTQMQMVALNWHIYEITHSALALGLIGLFRFLPIVFFSLIAGSFSDAHNRKIILFSTQAIMGALSAFLAIQTFSHAITPLSIYIITILFAVCTSFELPARQSLMPSLVAKKDFANAMSIYNIMWQIASIGGPALAGIAIASIGVGNIYFFNALSYGGLIFALVFMQTSGKVTGVVTPISPAAILEGLRFVKSQTIIWSTTLLDFVGTFFASATSLIPIFAKDILHVGPIGLGLLYSAPALGAIVAGLIMTHIGHVRRPGPLLLCGIALYGLGTIFFGISHIFILSLIALCLLGGGDSISTILRNTIRQLATPDHLRGRMSSITMIFFVGGPQLGDFEAGILAAAVGGPWSVIVGGIGTLLFIGLITYFVPLVRTYEVE